MWGVVIKRDIAVTPWVQEEKGLEAPPGFEPGIKDLQSSALPLGYGAAGSDCPEECCGVKVLRPTAFRVEGSPGRSCWALRERRVPARSRRRSRVRKLPETLKSWMYDAVNEEPD